MIDPSHGGNDKGANFSGKLMEKDITLRLARELRKELEERGIAARLLRESDIDLSLTVALKSLMNSVPASTWRFMRDVPEKV